MDRKDKNSYTLIYAGVMVVIVAVVLTSMKTSLGPLQKANELVAKKKDILLSVGVEDVETESFFSDKVEVLALNVQGETMDMQADAILDVDVKKENRKAADDMSRVLPIYIYKSDAGKNYIVPVYGKGLWDDIWGYIAFEDDMKTIVGVSFDHKGETPGLGAEIKDNSEWKAQFEDREIFNSKGEYVSVAVKKGVKKPLNEVNYVTGATMTCNGVTDMLYDGINAYLPYFETASKGN